MPSERERGLGTISHCLEWYKLVPRTRLPTPAQKNYCRLLQQLLAGQTITEWATIN